MNNFQKLFDLIGALARQRFQVAEQKFSGLGLNHTEARLLTLLQKENGVATQETLSNMLFVDRSNAGRGLKRLEHRGLISRRENDEAKRTKMVELTPDGRKTVLELSEMRDVMVQNFFGDLSEEEVGTVIGLLKRVLETPDDKLS